MEYFGLLVRNVYLLECFFFISQLLLLLGYQLKGQNLVGLYFLLNGFDGFLNACLKSLEILDD